MKKKTSKKSGSARADRERSGKTQSSRDKQKGQSSGAGQDKNTGRSMRGSDEEE
jgi:hypothetical protein